MFSRFNWRKNVPDFTIATGPSIKRTVGRSAYEYDTAEEAADAAEAKLASLLEAAEDETDPSEVEPPAEPEPEPEKDDGEGNG